MIWVQTVCKGHEQTTNVACVKFIHMYVTRGRFNYRPKPTPGTYTVIKLIICLIINDYSEVLSSMRGIINYVLTCIHFNIILMTEWSSVHFFLSLTTSLIVWLVIKITHYDFGISSFVYSLFIVVLLWAA